MPELQAAVIKRGQDILIGLTSCDTGLWGIAGYDQETIGSMSLFTPLTPWPQSKSVLFVEEWRAQSISGFSPHDRPSFTRTREITNHRKFAARSGQSMRS